LDWEKLDIDDPDWNLEDALDVYTHDEGSMQAKIRCYGDIVNGGYMKLRGEEVWEYLNKMTGAEVDFWKLTRYVVMYTIRQQCRIGDYVVILDSTEVLGDDIEEDNGLFNCLHVTGILTRSKEIKKGEEKLTRKKVSEKMERFIEHHKWAFGEKLEESDKRSLIASTSKYGMTSASTIPSTIVPILATSAWLLCPTQR
jgi:hypothetical protein